MVEQPMPAGQDDMLWASRVLPVFPISCHDRIAPITGDMTLVNIQTQ
jgi:hypothetical protein